MSLYGTSLVVTEGRMQKVGHGWLTAVGRDQQVDSGWSGDRSTSVGQKPGKGQADLIGWSGSRVCKEVGHARTRVLAWPQAGE
jgi:hypothetical protein